MVKAKGAIGSKEQGAFNNNNNNNEIINFFYSCSCTCMDKDKRKENLTTNLSLLAVNNLPRSSSGLM